MTLLNDAARRISHTLRFAFYRATHRYNTIYIIYHNYLSGRLAPSQTQKQTELIYDNQQFFKHPA